MPVRESRPPRTLLRALPALLIALASLAVVGPLTRGAHAATRVWGVDVASYQHPNGAAINWRAVKADGASFAMVKATEGTTYTNPWFASDWAGIRAAGLVRASYAFGRPALPYSTAVDQARFFLSTLGTTDEAGDLPPMLDLEVTGGLSPAQLTTWTKTWLQTVASLTGRTPLVYVGQYFVRDQLGGTAGLARYPWWLPAYSSTAPRAPYAGGWSHWTMWQYTSQATVPGISGLVDASDFDGTPAQLASFADGRNTLIASKYASLGGARGVLGVATSGVIAIATGGFGQTFAHGAITEVGGVAHALWGATGERYVSLGAWRSSLGVAARDTAHNGAGDVSFCTRGWILAQTARPAYVVAGSMLRGFQATGGLATDGYPLSDSYAVGHPTPAGDLSPITGGVEQDFGKGDLFFSSKSGTHPIRGAILALYKSLDGASGTLGMPASDQYAGTLGPQVDFQGGSIVYVAALRHAVAT